MSNIDLPVDTTRVKPLTLYSPEYFKYYPLARKLQFLKTNQMVLQLMKQGAEYSYLQPPERDGKDVMPSIQFGALALLLTVQAHTRAHAGNWDEAADSILNVLRFSYQMQRGTSLRGALRGNATRMRGEKELRYLLPHLSREKTKFVTQKIESWQANRVLPAQVFTEEKRAMQAVILQLIRSRDFRPIYVGYGCIGDCTVSPEQYEDDLNKLPALLKMRLAWMEKPHLLTEYSRCIDWHIAQVKLPFPQRAQSAPFPESDDGVQQIIYPEFNRTLKSFAIQETNTALTLTLLALHSYKLEHKKYPQKLSALVPEYLSRVPLDPCSNGQELRYRIVPVRYIVAPKSPKVSIKAATVKEAAPSDSPQYRYGQMPFTLYSIGLNARDDGGIPYSKDLSQNQNCYRVDLSLPNSAPADIVAGIN